MINENENQAVEPSFFGPGAVDVMLRETFKLCWMSLPKERKTVAAIESEMRRLFNRAVDDLREDAQAFGLPVDNGCKE